jgi:transcriptional regulator with XRE-family HTH domain
MTLAGRTKLAREKRGLGQRGLATKAGLSNAYDSQLEDEDKGRIKNPGIDAIRKLSAALNVPLDWLASGEGPEPTWSEPSEGSAAE